MGELRRNDRDLRATWYGRCACLPSSFEMRLVLVHWEQIVPWTNYFKPDRQHSLKNDITPVDWRDSIAYAWRHHNENLQIISNVPINLITISNELNLIESRNSLSNQSCVGYWYFSDACRPEGDTSSLMCPHLWLCYIIFCIDISDVERIGFRSSM